MHFSRDADGRSDVEEEEEEQETQDPAEHAMRAAFNEEDQLHQHLRSDVTIVISLLRR